MGPCCLLLLLAWTMATLLPARARAQEATRLLIVAEGADTLSQRLAAELSALGFAPVIVAAQRRQDPALECVELMRREHAAAALWLQSTKSGTVALILAREQRPTETHALRRASGTSDAMWAVQLIELLRPALLGLPVPVPAPPIAPHAPDAVGAPDSAQKVPLSAPALAPPTPPPVALIDEELVRAHMAKPGPEPSARLATVLGLGMLGARGMAPVSALSGTLSMLVLPPSLRLELVALIPLQRMELERKEAKTLSRITFLGLDLRLDLLRTHTFQLSLALGGALSLLKMQSRTLGEPATPDKTNVSACPYLRLGSTYRLTRVIALRGEAIVGAFLDTLQIFVAPQDLPQPWGRPWFAGFFAVEARFP